MSLTPLDDNVLARLGTILGEAMANNPGQAWQSKPCLPLWLALFPKPVLFSSTPKATPCAQPRAK